MQRIEAGSSAVQGVKMFHLYLLYTTVFGIVKNSSQYITVYGMLQSTKRIQKLKHVSS